MESRPTDGFIPTMALSPAGTRPLPAVSVPSANEATSVATATADPDEEPPGIILSSSAFFGTPRGVRVPFNPAANWSMLTLPMQMHPAFCSAETTGALGLWSVRKGWASGSCGHPSYVYVVLDREEGAP